MTLFVAGLSHFHVGKEVRTQTGIGLGATSVGGVAAELAQQIFRHDFSRQSVLIIGAGTMGEACVRHLSRKGAGSILISNRSLDRANNLAHYVRSLYPAPQALQE